MIHARESNLEPALSADPPSKSPYNVRCHVEGGDSHGRCPVLARARGVLTNLAVGWIGRFWTPTLFIPQRTSRRSVMGSRSTTKTGCRRRRLRFDARPAHRDARPAARHSDRCRGGRGHRRHVSSIRESFVRGRDQVVMWMIGPSRPTEPAPLVRRFRRAQMGGCVAWLTACGISRLR